MISILLSCYRSNEEYLKQQINSIFAQTETDWELLIYDDGNDDLQKILYPFMFDKRVHYYNAGHKGYAKAYNYLLKKAKGEYVCFCDHDDIWVKDKLEIEKKYLDEHPDVDCVFGWLNWFGEKEKLESFSILDEEISKELEKQYKKQGIDIMTNASVESVDTSGAGVRALVKKQDGSTVTLEADIVLSAVGVVANIENIGLEENGIKTEKGKIIVDKYQQTSVPGIYAIGDCSPGQALAHVASKEGINAAEHIAYHEKKIHHLPDTMDYNNIPGCTYCIPEIASVGYTEKAAKEAGYEIKVGKFPFMASGKASAAGATDGFVKVIYDAKYGEFLGCHMIGTNVTEMIAEAVVARKLETTAHEILNAVHPHPTMSEGLKEATAAAYGEAIDI